MANFWMYFKRVVLVWGFIWLAIVLFIAITLALQNLSARNEAKQQEQQDMSFKKTVGDINLKVARDSVNQDKLLVSVEKKNISLVTNFELPAKQFNLSWLEVDDASVFKIKDDSYRIILFSSESESDHDFSHEYIWVFRLNKKMNFEKLFNVSDVHKMPGDPTFLFGNLEIDLPDYGKEEFVVVDVPVEIRVGSSISMRPMLNRESLDKLSEHYTKFIKGRIAQLTDLKDESMLKKYKIALQDFEDAIVEKQY